MKFPVPEALEQLSPAGEAAFPSPIPTQVVASDEYFPQPQSAKRKLADLASDSFARSRRRAARIGPGRSNPRCRTVRKRA
jgi:hypothetical protein